MVISELTISKNQYLSEVLPYDERGERTIPTNCILDKTLPGLGATSCELEAHRNSIIIEPNIPVITGKCKKNKNWLAVYEKTTDKKIETYLTNENIEFKKILCTPESYMRVKSKAEGQGIDIYNEYFCLFDECEKITQDIDYRELITLPIKDFFSYQEKAFVSATPLEFRNPDFEANGFYKLKVKPDYQYLKKIDLVVTNRYDKTVIEKLDELKDSPLICVFLNSTNGINKLINHLEKKGIKDYKAFCSRKSVLKNNERDIRSYEDLDLPFAKYNFFTSRFFSAVDIFTDRVPDIIILTDLNEAKYSMIDPATNSIQIYGRFRYEFESGNKFNSLTHIANTKGEESVFSNEEIEQYINKAEIVYNTIKRSLGKETNNAKKQLLSDDLKKLTYNKFINDDNTKNYFAIDNFYDDERIKGYYLSADNLLRAYEKTNHFKPNLILKNEIIGDKLLLNYKRLQSDIESRKFIIEILESLSAREEITPEEIEYAKNQFRKHENRDKADVAIYIIDAYEKIGGEVIRNVGFKKTSIDLLLKKFTQEKEKNLMFSKAVREKVEKMFEQHIWEKAEFIEKLQQIFYVHGINQNVRFATIKKYGGADELKGMDTKGQIKLGKFQPDFEFD
jgi:hypothetical protein